MFRTMAELKVVKTDDRSATISVAELKNPIVLVVRKYERGAVLEIPWIWKDRLGAPNYEALKAILRPAFGHHIETRTEVDPRFTEAALARRESMTVA